MLGSITGAHRASSWITPPSANRRHRLAGLALGGSVLMSLALAPTAGAAGSTTGAATADATPLTTTAVDRPWYSTERYYLGLLNCTRTGGWVLSDGTCRGYGSGHYSSYVAPITYNFGLSDKVSRPYAQLLAVRGLCTHTADGDPGTRLRRAGYLRWNWGENIGCREGYSTTKAAVLASHLNMQAEKSSNGGHWRNMKNGAYHWVGIGVWMSGTRIRLVTDFYG